MKERVLRVGVIGTAEIAVSRVIPALSKSDKVSVVAIASRDGRKAREWAEKLGVKLSFGSYEELLECTEVEAVYIPLPNSLHAEWSIRALKMGKHVMCEKPLAMSGEEVARMIQTARENDLVLMEGFMYRFHPRNETVFKMVRGGEIGTLRAIESAFSYFLTNEASYLMSRELGGGALYDVGCYCVNVSRMLAGEEPSEVYGMWNLSRTGVDINFSGILRFPGGVLSNFHVSMNEEPRFYYRAVGEKGLIEVPWAFVSFGRVTNAIIQKNEKSESLTFDPCDEYRHEFEHFTDTIFKNTPPRYSIEDSLNNIRILEALVRSAQRGLPQKVQIDHFNHNV
ncbi:MAG: Gfo/Idh/MocA family protein [Spirochaetota bacterium]